MQITNNLSINYREEWIEIVSECDNQFISVSPDEFDKLIKVLQKAKQGYKESDEATWDSLGRGFIEHEPE